MNRLIELTQSPQFGDRLLDVVGGIQVARDEPSMIGALERFKALLGIDHASFISLIKDDGSHESVRFLGAVRETGWYMAYRRANAIEADPWLTYSMQNTTPVCDADIPLRSQTEHDVRKIAQRFGICSAFVVPAPSSPGRSRLGIFLLGSSTPNYFESPAVRRIQPLVQGVAMMIHEWWIRRLRESLVRQIKLLPDEIELLRLIRNGMSTTEIALSLQLPESTINKRAQRINGKFGQPSRAVCARIATEYGLI